MHTYFLRSIDLAMLFQNPKFFGNLPLSFWVVVSWRLSQEKLNKYLTSNSFVFVVKDADDDTICYHPWHLDNVQAGGIKGFSLIVGVFLNDTPKPDSGNFTVFPGAHIVLEKHFRKVGCSTNLYRHKYGKIILPDVDIGEQRQILAKAGDIVICHYQLPHRAAPNISSHIRMAVFFWIYHKHLLFEHPVDCNIRYFAMTNLWAKGWAGMKTIQRYEFSHVS